VNDAEADAAQYVQFATEWLNGPSDPGTVATAQVYATLAIAAALLALADRLTQEKER